MSTSNDTTALPGDVDVELGSVEEESDRHLVRTSGKGRRSRLLLGKETYIDDTTAKRVQWAQRAIGLLTFSGVFFYIIGEIVWMDGFRIFAIGCGVVALVCFVLVFYDNISFVMVKRLFKEPNVIIIVALTLCNWAIDIGRPAISLSPVNGFLYMLTVNAFVLADAVVLKSRYLMLGFGFLFIALNLYNLYDNTLGSGNEGVLLLDYTIQGKKHTIMKRSTKRSIYLQVLLFSAKGIYTTFVDKSMKLMVFASGHIYRSTGTASEEIKAVSFAVQMEHERSRGKVTEAR